MKTQKRVVEYETVYIAEDGKKFDSKNACLIYEKYYKKNILDLVKDYIIFDNKAIENISKNKTPVFCYALMVKRLPIELVQYFRILEEYEMFNDLVPIDENVMYKPLPRLYYCNYSSSYNGDYGWNGWQDIGTTQSITEEIEKLQKHIKIIEELKN